MPKLPPQPVQEARGYSHPVLGGGLGDYAFQLLSDPGGLTPSGAFVEIMPPVAQPSFRHWHETEDEMVLMLAGEVVLVEAEETLPRAGDVACWPAGLAIGRCLHNRGAADARYLVLGSRRAQDVIHYPDLDLTARKDAAARAWFPLDGRPR